MLVIINIVKHKVVQRRGNIIAILVIATLLAVGYYQYMRIVEDSRHSAYYAKTRATFHGYTIALTQYRTMYGYYPPVFDESGYCDLSKGDNSEKFILALTGRDAENNPTTASSSRKSIPFYSFADDEILIDKETGQHQIVDAYGNPNIVILVDHDDDGIIMAPVDGKLQEVKAKVVVYTLPLRDKAFVSSYD